MAMTSKQRRLKRAALKAQNENNRKKAIADYWKAHAQDFEPKEVELWENKPSVKDRPLPRYESMMDQDASCFKRNKETVRNHKPLQPSSTVTGKDQKGYIQKSISFHDYIENCDKIKG